MASSFFFYDLETSGINPKDARIMQFAGQRTDLAMNPIGEAHSYMIALTDDVLPDPDAVLVTGITPQRSRSEGMTEAAFLKIFYEQIVTEDTIFVGYNTLRFDDEFMRYLHYRNFYDPYEWHWKEGCSRWDLLDVVRMTRALRPDGIKWPFDSSGKPSNRLGLLTAVNGIDHADAHDALCDVKATIELAQLIRSKQPKLFDFLLAMRDKKKIAELIQANELFLYTSGKYDSAGEKTTVVTKLADHPKRAGVLVYDLRYDPTPFMNMKPIELVEAWRWKKDAAEPRLPVKTLQFNRCPAIAPLSVLDAASRKRLGIDLGTVRTNQSKLVNNDEFVSLLMQALELMDEKQQAQLLETEADVDARLYEGFFSDLDKTKMSMVRAAEGEELLNMDVSFKDQRLQALLPLYKSRNFPESLNEEERQTWEKFREQKLLSGNESSRLARYFKRIHELSQQQHLSAEKQYLLEELTLYGQSIMPVDA